MAPRLRCDGGMKKTTEITLSTEMEMDRISYASYKERDSDQDVGWNLGVGWRMPFKRNYVWGFVCSEDDRQQNGNAKSRNMMMMGSIRQEMD